MHDPDLVGMVQRLGRLHPQLRHRPEIVPAAARLRRRRQRASPCCRRRSAVGSRRPAAAGRPCSPPVRPGWQPLLYAGRRRSWTTIAERLAIDELHGVEMDAAFAADGEDGHDVAVVQAGRRPRLVLEALQPPRVHRRGERQHLQRHAPAQRQLLRLVDHAHAAPADLADDAEVAEQIRRRTIGHRRGRGHARKLLRAGWTAPRAGAGRSRFGSPRIEAAPRSSSQSIASPACIRTVGRSIRSARADESDAGRPPSSTLLMTRPPAHGPSRGRVTARAHNAPFFAAASAMPSTAPASRAVSPSR